MHLPLLPPHVMQRAERMGCFPSIPLRHCMEHVEQYNLVEQWSRREKNGQSNMVQSVLGYFVYPLMILSP